MNKKKVLIITYYWPPSGGAGVQRWLKFTKYLGNFNWQPIIYTVKNGEFPVIDLELEKEVPGNIEVIKQPIWEPYKFYKKFTGRKKDDKINTGFLSEGKKSKLFEGLSVWIRGNFFIPDARKFWIKPSIKYLSNYILKNKIDVIISSGPPHSCHLIALELKNKFSLKWIADFRDPWTNIDFYEKLKLSKYADKIHKSLESKVLTNADVILSVGRTLGEELKDLGAKRLEVIENGYDAEDLKSTDKIDLDSKFTIAHIGSFSPSRNHPILWKALSELINENNNFANNFKLKLVGKVDVSVFEEIKKNKLNDYVIHIPYLSHKDVIKEQRKSHLLLLSVNNTPNALGIVTGKVFEYMASGRPTLLIGPKNGDVAKIIKECNAGIICEFDELNKLKETILSFYNKEQSIVPNAEKYSRLGLTEKLAKTLNNII